MIGTTMGSDLPEFSSLFRNIDESLKREGLYLDSDKKPDSPDASAVQAVNEALHQAKLLNDSWDDISKAARYLEKIQVAAARAERAALVSHAPLAEKSYHLANRIAAQGRELFHQMKKGRKKI